MPEGVRYLNSANGVLKILHVVLGGLSLLLLGFSYVPYWALDIFLITVAVCFGCSTLYLFLNVALGHNFTKNRTNKLISSIFHITAGILLIAAGIDLIGWSDYDNHCGFKCPRIYYIGMAKVLRLAQILTFINGTLYGIHGFLEAKGEDEDFLEESIPLFTSSLDPGIQIIVHPPQDDLPHSSRNPRNGKNGHYQEMYNSFQVIN